jgi:hypothetical protein
MNREEHLQWAKNRAMEYVRVGDLTNAVASMGSDLCKHDELKTHVAIPLGMQLLLSREFDKKALITRWIQGFN